MPERTVPDAEYTRPSAWNPGWPAPKPRSTTSSDSSQADGRVPVRWNHTVCHGQPHADPTGNGVYGCARASANATGSPGTVHACTVSGLRSRYTAGTTRSRTTRATRCRT